MLRVHGQRCLTVVLVVLGCTVSMLIGAGSASAHDNTGKAIGLTVTERRVLGSAPVPFTEIGYEDTSGDGLLDADEMRAQEATVAAGLVGIVRDHVRLEVDGREFAVIGAGSAPAAGGSEASEYVNVRFATAPHDGDVSEVGLAWSFTSPTTQVMLSAPDRSVAGVLGDDGTASITLSAATTVRSFFLTGIDHVILGFDHLLFLVVLTLAVVGASVTSATTWRVVRLVTAFTVGHATSLTLAYFGLVSVPAHWVEPAIALSVVAAAVLALRGKNDGIRPWIAALVGLVHGLGFASSLGDLGLATTHRVGALAAFNVGVDVAQTAVVLLVTGAMWVSSKALADHQGWIRTAVCGAAAALGLAWTISRLAL